MGTVYRARDPKIDRIVAVKTIRLAASSPEQEEEARRRFRREAQAAGKLSHPGIVTVYDVAEDESTRPPTPYIAVPAPSRDQAIRPRLIVIQQWFMPK